MARTVSIAACNFLVRTAGSFDYFAQHCKVLLDRAREADIVIFPELFTVELLTTTPDWENAELADLKRLADFTDAFCQFFEEEARQREQHILAGSHLVRDGDGELRNVSFLYGPDGLVHRHAKTHIFPAESDWDTAEGDDMEVVELPFARVGVNICYEAEIPECAAALADQGAEIILCPSFTFTENGFWRVRHCAQARCIENQLYFVHCCTGGGPVGPVPSGWARSSILSPCDLAWDSPNGVVAEATSNEEDVVKATVDLDLIYENRATGAAPTFRDRRRRAGVYTRWPSHITTKPLAETAAVSGG